MKMIIFDFKQHFAKRREKFNFLTQHALNIINFSFEAKNVRKILANSQIFTLHFAAFHLITQAELRNK